MSKQETVDFSLTTEEINLMLESLGQMPYVKVYQLIDKITETSYKQLNGKKAEPAVTETAVVN